MKLNAAQWPQARRHEGRQEHSEDGTTLIELMVSVAIFAIIMGITYGSLGLVQQQTNNSVTQSQSAEGGMIALNEMAVEVRDLSNTFDNTYQGSDANDPDIVTMDTTELRFLSGNEMVANDASGKIDDNLSQGSFTTGCANLIDIKLVGTTLQQTEISPTIDTSGDAANGECQWTGTGVTTVLASNVEPLCSGVACSTSTAGATIFTYYERYPNQFTTVAPGTGALTTAVGEIAIGFAILPANGSKSAAPVVLNQTVRLGAVLSDPSSGDT